MLSYQGLHSVALYARNLKRPPNMNPMHLTSGAEKTQDEHIINGGHPTLGSHLNRGNPMKP